MAKNNLILGILLTVIPLIVVFVIAIGVSLPALGGFDMMR